VGRAYLAEFLDFSVLTFLTFPSIGFGNDSPLPQGAVIYARLHERELLGVTYILS